MSNQPETNETPATGYTPAPRKVGLPRFFELLGRDLWAFYRASFLCLLGFLPGTALAVFGQMGGSALLTVLGGLLGGLIGGKAGAIVGGLNFRSKTADGVLTVTDVRSSEQVAISEGSARKSDIGFGAGGGLFGGSGFGAAGVGGYANTEIGQVITMAYLQAYTDIVAQLGGLPANASAANAQQAVTMTKPGRLFPNAKGTGKIVRTLDAGMMLYPTGNKEGMMWEVEDELGNKGWVSSTLFELAR